MAIGTLVVMSSDESDNKESYENKIDQILKELISFKKYTIAKFDENKEANRKILKNFEEIKGEIKKLKLENEALKLELKNQKDKTHFLERQFLQSTLSIPNVPKDEGEDLRDIFYNIASKSGVKLTTSSISNIYRKKDKQNKNPGDIIVKIAAQATHDLLLAQVKKKKLTFDDIGFKGNSNILYLNHELTPLDKSILYEAKQLQKSNNWKYVWEKNGFIYVRKIEGGRVVRISSKENLKDLVAAE